ncbi:sensor histidine kinase [Sphingobacterium daejeonense]|uniref:Sensor histidine kinase n=1 Tax=Sphingobacterium daejeonense TaxID=371142 RepID=A0ABW3RFZ7_9SPHI
MKTFLTSLLYAIVISLMIYFCIAIFVLFATGSLEMSFITAPESVAGIAYGIFLYLTGSFTGLLLNKLIPDRSKALPHILGYIILTIIFAPIVVFLINFSIEVLWLGNSFDHFIQNEFWYAYIPITIIAILIGVGWYGFYYYKQFKNRQIAHQKLIAGEATAQLESLKNQIDPHFLFNSLNVLIGLIEEDQKNAITYTKSLSRIYRYILEHKDQEYVTIKEELEFAKDYITLLQLRFENSIQYENLIDVKKLNKKTVPLSLQLLLENCIKHNKISEEQPLRIRIYDESDMLVVENNLQEKSNHSASTKIGLRNIRDRYLLTSKKDIHITKSQDRFIVKMPML